MKTIITNPEEIVGQTIESIVAYEGILCIHTETGVLAMEQNDIGEYKLAELDAGSKVALGIMSEDEFNEKKAIFNELKKDFLTVHDAVLEKAAKLEW